MPVLSITVSLSEVLEVRAGPLTDAEIWALLCQAAETLQDIFLAGESRCENIPAFVINPDTIYLTSMGQVEFGSTQKVQQYANYMAPDTEEENMLTDAATEQVYVFALGKSLIYSSEYGLKSDEPVRISESLESLLRRMTHRNSSQRISLLKVMEACGIQKKSRTRGLDRSFSQTVTNLYQTVLGLEGQSEENMETYTNTPSHQNISPRELIVDRSRRKQKKHRDSRRRKHSSPEQYRSRSRARSRSRSHSKHKDTGRRSDSPDSGYHRTSPLPKTMYSRSGDKKHNGASRPELLTTDYATGQSYHLSDITFSASQNGHPSHRALAASSHHHSRPSSRTSANPKDIDNPVFKKYLKLKERQRKLRALRHDAMSDEASDELSDIVMDHMSETRSVRSMGSRNVGEFGGVYHPDLHMHYGSKSALKMGKDSDRESVVSSDNSAYGPDHQPFRAAGDISDPYIEHLQKVSAAKPPQLPTFDKHEPASKQKKKPPSPRQLKPRDFYGPEFMHRSTKPIQRIPIALQGESRKNPGRVCRVVIVLLNGQKMEAMVDPSTTGQQLFEAVVTEIELPEFYFFGLTYVNDNEHFFITGDTKLHKIAPEGWKESWKREAAPVTFSVYLRVKFYVENLHALKHETSRHQLYLQLRRDILEERCQCDEERAMTLAGLAMQAEYGDYNKDTMGRNYFSPEHYFSGQMVKRLGTGYLKDHAPETHKQLSGLAEVEAQMEFIQFVQENLPEYGIHFHKLLKEKKGKTADIIWVGINMDHLVLSEDSAGQRIMVHQYLWSAIQKISFNRRRFSVQPRPEISQMKPFKMNFYTNSYKKGQYLLKFCTAQHSFQLKIKTRLASHDGMPDLSQDEHMSIGDTEDMGSVHSEDEHTITDEVESKDVQVMGPKRKPKEAAQASPAQKSA